MGIDWDIQTFDTLPSTMTVAREKAEAGAVEGLVVVAKEQTAGIGRFGNTWIAPPGNLYCSLILDKPHHTGQYSFIAAVALANAVMPLLRIGRVYKHKWPNDGLIDGRKFAGILLQSGTGFLNMGLGINITSAPPEKAFLNDSAAKILAAPDVLTIYLDCLDRSIDLYRRDGFSPIRAQWLENTQGLYEPITVRLPSETLQGVFNGIDDQGALLLGLDNGSEKVIHSGEVFFGSEI